MFLPFGWHYIVSEVVSEAFLSKARQVVSEAKFLKRTAFKKHVGASSLDKLRKGCHLFKGTPLLEGNPV